VSSVRRASTRRRTGSRPVLLLPLYAHPHQTTRRTGGLRWQSHSFHRRTPDALPAPGRVPGHFVTTPSRLQLSEKTGTNDAGRPSAVTFVRSVTSESTVAERFAIVIGLLVAIGATMLFATARLYVPVRRVGRYEMSETCRVLRSRSKRSFKEAWNSIARSMSSRSKSVFPCRAAISSTPL
jgi:hypothetical protein